MFAHLWHTSLEKGQFAFLAWKEKNPTALMGWQDVFVQLDVALAKSFPLHEQRYELY